jgi:hypothetical protein
MIFSLARQRFGIFLFLGYYWDCLIVGLLHYIQSLANVTITTTACSDVCRERRRISSSQNFLYVTDIIGEFETSTELSREICSKATQICKGNWEIYILWISKDHAEDRGSTFHRNNCYQLLDRMEAQPTRPRLTSSLAFEPQIWNTNPISCTSHRALLFLSERLIYIRLEKIQIRSN